MNLHEILFLSQAWAVSAAGAEDHAPSIAGLLFPLVNFLIFAYLLKRFLLPFVEDYLRSRRAGILTAVQEAEQGRESAESLVRDYRARIRRLEQETVEIRESLRSDGEKEKAKLVREAQDLAAKIKADADFLADQEVKLARQKLRGEMARIAKAKATELVQGHLTAADQSRLVEEFLSGVGQTG